MTDLSRRQLVAEVMDDPALPAEEHRRALRGLRRLNQVSRCVSSLWRAMADGELTKKGSELSVLDVATGGGDVPLGLWRLARRAGVAARIVGVDISETAVAAASKEAERAGADVVFRQLDLFDGHWPGGFDVVICSLFLHHLTEGQAVELLGRMRGAAGAMVVVSDLSRSRLGLIAAQLACHLLTTSPVVRTDGPRSVKAAFTAQEAHGLAQAAGLEQSIVQPCWPWRWLLTWNKR